MSSWFKYPESLSCLSKKKYKTIIEASDAGKMQMYNNNYTIQLYMYECDYCKQYHLTQQVTDLKV